MIAALEEAGFSVEETRALKYKISKRRDDHEFVVEGMAYYLAMIQQYFFPEGAIISLLNATEGQIGGLNASGPQRIELLIEQRV